MSTESNKVPKALQNWFVLHAVIDLLFAIPLMIAPIFTLELFGWQTVDVISARIVAAALFGIGIESYLGRNAVKEVFVGMLNLKIIWSLAVIIGVSWSLFQNAQGTPWMGWILVGIFFAFNLVWVYWRKKIG